jgi:DUF1365 family protein
VNAFNAWRITWNQSSLKNTFGKRCIFVVPMTYERNKRIENGQRRFRAMGLVSPLVKFNRETWSAESRSS